MVDKPGEEEWVSVLKRCRVSKWINRVEQRLCISPTLVLSLFVTLIRLEWWIQNAAIFNLYKLFLRTVVHYRTISTVRTPPTTTPGCDNTPTLCQILPPGPAFPRDSTKERRWSLWRDVDSQRSRREGENEPPTS